MWLSRNSTTDHKRDKRQKVRRQEQRELRGIAATALLERQHDTTPIDSTEQDSIDHDMDEMLKHSQQVSWQLELDTVLEGIEPYVNQPFINVHDYLAYVGRLIEARGPLNTAQRAQFLETYLRLPRP